MRFPVELAPIAPGSVNTSDGLEIKRLLLVNPLRGHASRVLYRRGNMADMEFVDGGDSSEGDDDSGAGAVAAMSAAQPKRPRLTDAPYNDDGSWKPQGELRKKKKGKGWKKRYVAIVSSSNASLHRAATHPANEGALRRTVAFSGILIIE